MTNERTAITMTEQLRDAMLARFDVALDENDFKAGIALINGVGAIDMHDMGALHAAMSGWIADGTAGRP